MHHVIFKNRTKQANMPWHPLSRFSSAALALSHHTHFPSFFFFFFLNQRPAKRISTLHIIRRSRSNHSIQKDQKHLGINQYYQTSPHFIFFFIFFFSHSYTLSLSLWITKQSLPNPLSLSLVFSLISFLEFSRENHGERSRSLLRYWQESQRSNRFKLKQIYFVFCLF